MKYLTALLNSSLVKFWLRYKGKMQGNNYQIDKEPLLGIPIKKPTSVEVYVKFIDYILLTLAQEKPLNEHVPNSHISETFEEVIDAIVFELYFPEEFEKAGIHFIQYAERDFESIEGKSLEEQATIIHKAYQKLREKDNEIRNNLKAMKIELRDLLMPILTV